MISIFVAVMLVLIFGFVGLAIDSGHVRAAGAQLQDTADAAALAAAEALANEINTPAALTGYPSTRQKARDMAAANRAAGQAVQLDANAANVGGGDVVLGVWTPSARTFALSCVCSATAGYSVIDAAVTSAPVAPATGLHATVTV